MPNIRGAVPNAMGNQMAGNMSNQMGMNANNMNMGLCTTRWKQVQEC